MGISIKRLQAEVRRFNAISKLNQVKDGAELLARSVDGVITIPATDTSVGQQFFNFRIMFDIK